MRALQFQIAEILLFSPQNYQNTKQLFLAQGGWEEKLTFEKCLIGLPVKGTEGILLVEKSPSSNTPNTWQLHNHDFNRALGFPATINEVCSALETKQRGSKQTKTPALMAAQGNGVTTGHISKPVQELCVLEPIAFTHQPLVGLH